MPMSNEQRQHETNLSDFTMLHKRARSYWDRGDLRVRWDYYHMRSRTKGDYGEKGWFDGPCFGGPFNGKNYSHNTMHVNVAEHRGPILPTYYPSEPCVPKITHGAYVWSDFLGGWLYRGPHNA